MAIAQQDEEFGLQLFERVGDASHRLRLKLPWNGRGSDQEKR